MWKVFIVLYGRSMPHHAQHECSPHQMFCMFSHCVLGIIPRDCQTERLRLTLWLLLLLLNLLLLLVLVLLVR